MSDLGHGLVGKREQSFTKLLPLRANAYDPIALAKLAEDMKGGVDSPKDGPDPEENILVPAGYTYFGQFVDHDLTFDSTSSIAPDNAAVPTNLRTPRFDLDCVYGDGPAAQPYLYDNDGKLLFNNGPLPNPPTNSTTIATHDLLRNPTGRAIIGDKRNDENSIVSQLQLSFIKYHNAVIDELNRRDPATWNVPNQRFESARNEVRWTYQKLVVEDFLPRIVKPEVLANLQGKSKSARSKNYALYGEDKRVNLPLEFVAAVYRFGHSGVRTGYRLNAHPDNRFSIFPASSDATVNASVESLLGFDPLTNNQIIDNWARFFPDSLPGTLPTEPRTAPAGDVPNPAVRLQFAYKIDPTLVDPLGVLPRQQVAGEETAQQAEAAIAPRVLPLFPAPPATSVTPSRPSLALLNLLRGDSYRIQSGQSFSRALQGKGFPAQTLEHRHLAIRRPVSGHDGKFKFVPIAAEFLDDTPLWFYVLAEAQTPLVEHFKQREFDEAEMLNGVGAVTQLGWVGGRIVAEVFYGLLDSDEESFVNAAPRGWSPILQGTSVIVRNLLRFADSRNS